MAENSKIEWCDHTFNPWVGCTKISPACDSCYAEGWAKRTGQAALWHGERRRTSEANWQQPLKWNRQAEREGRRFRVFCASLADVFDNQVPAEWRSDLWTLIDATPHLDWLLLTKRPQNIAKMIETARRDLRSQWPAPRIWLGTTVENQEEAERRIPALLQVPAAVHFLSCEPLLGRVALIDFLRPPPALPGRHVSLGNGRWIVDADGSHLMWNGIGWAITGGESGPGSRPSHPDWFRQLRDQCKAASLPFFFKQHGDWREWDHQPETDEVDADSELADAIAASACNPAWITPDGQVYHRQEDLPDGVPCRLVERLGKNAAGRLLDGREHNEFPR